MTSARHIMRIELTPLAKKQLGQCSDKHGMTQVAMMSRLMNWFAMQDETIQGAVLGHYPESIEPEIAKLILSHLATKRDGKADGSTRPASARRG